MKRNSKVRPVIFILTMRCECCSGGELGMQTEDLNEMIDINIVTADVTMDVVKVQSSLLIQRTFCQSQKISSQDTDQDTHHYFSANHQWRHIAASHKSLLVLFPWNCVSMNLHLSQALAQTCFS